MTTEQKMNTGTWVVKISDAGTAPAAHFIAAFRPTEPYDVIEC